MEEKPKPIYIPCKCLICEGITQTKKAMVRHLKETHNIAKHPKRFYKAI